MDIIANAGELWSKPCHLFAVIYGVKVSRLKHDMHSLKKGPILVKECVAKIKGTCDLLEAFGHPISTVDQIDIVLVGISVEFDSMLTMASFSFEPLTIEWLVNILLECEHSQQIFVSEVSVQVNLV
ncbi:hypothetical protein PVK06_044194 [Gossypium arboreum]|uniref:Uncharacterized protein n=1 Tax=Gossypium arboreum TaxID=29729 RepID=A0ABR0MQY7_GOSAR|nr:hypothetical protein PVK06_044194 [Gossypium arboreum]